MEFFVKIFAIGKLTQNFLGVSDVLAKLTSL